MSGTNSRGRKATRRPFTARFRLLNAFVDRGAIGSLRHMDALVWVVLYRHARPDRTVRLSAGRLAATFGTHRTTIFRSLRRLRDEGLITRVRGGDRLAPRRATRSDRMPPVNPFKIEYAYNASGNTTATLYNKSYDLCACGCSPLVHSRRPANGLRGACECDGRTIDAAVR
jgi:hypothetical protein